MDDSDAVNMLVRICWPFSHPRPTETHTESDPVQTTWGSFPLLTGLLVQGVNGAPAKLRSEEPAGVGHQHDACEVARRWVNEAEQGGIHHSHAGTVG